MKTVHEKLKALRKEAGLRQEQIADFLGVTQAYISQIENGERNLTVDQLETLVNLYGYSLSVFTNMQERTMPVRFAFRAQEISSEDLKTIAEIGKIAVNSRFMKDLLEEVHD